MDNAQSQLIEKLQSSTNILVTVSRNPSVDQLAACVGLTILLNKFGKHATAVFSGEIPSTLEFLQPEKTLEKTTDSLRDFIIALDKSKADKLRYKVEDDMVRIFITPYRVSLTDKDLEFSQGDFNVDVVIALGVAQQEDFDEAITAHGRILHDAVVSSIATTTGSNLGSINLSVPAASSLSEIIVGLARALGTNLLDEQVATALLTGIVSETERFSNEKTTPQTMSISAELMAAGANQQLVATKLDRPEAATTPIIPNNQPSIPTTESPAATVIDAPLPDPVPAPQSADGALEIDHTSIDAVLEDLAVEEELPQPEPVAGPVFIEEPIQEAPVEIATELPEPVSSNQASRLIVEPPTLGGRLTANSIPEALDPANDVLGVSNQPPPALLNRTPLPAAPVRKQIEPLLTGFTPPPPAWIPATQDATNQLNGTLPPGPFLGSTLTDIESAVHQPVATPLSADDSVDSARDEVLRALTSQPALPGPVQALGAQPLGDPLRQPVASPVEQPPVPGFSDVLNQVIPPTLSGIAPPQPQPYVAQPTVMNPNAPPPVPPPIPFNFGASSQPPQQ